MSVDIALVVGSLRRESLNRKLGEACAFGFRLQGAPDR